MRSLSPYNSTSCTIQQSRWLFSHILFLSSTFWREFPYLDLWESHVSLFASHFSPVVLKKFRVFGIMIRNSRFLASNYITQKVDALCISTYITIQIPRSFACFAEYDLEKTIANNYWMSKIPGKIYLSYTEFKSQENSTWGWK